MMYSSLMPQKLQALQGICVIALFIPYIRSLYVFIYIFTHFYIQRTCFQFCRMIVGPSNREAKIVDLTDESEEKALLGKVAGGCG